MRALTGGSGGVNGGDAPLVAGVDEVGRGPLAGPVVVGAVILNPGEPIQGLTDSKRLTARRREDLAMAIRVRASAWSLVHAEPAEIDARNILQCTLDAMREAVAALPLAPAHVRVDGNRCPELPCPATAVVGGDLSEPAISAAAILAKVERDRVMRELDAVYPGYGFARHKGYPTARHVEALRQLGASAVHRRSFAPVRAVLTQPELALDDPEQDERRRQ